jgi:hypothetical protein
MRFNSVYPHSGNGSAYLRAHNFSVGVNLLVGKLLNWVFENSLSPCTLHMKVPSQPLTVPVLV